MVQHSKLQDLHITFILVLLLNASVQTKHSILEDILNNCNVKQYNILSIFKFIIIKNEINSNLYIYEKSIGHLIFYTYNTHIYNPIVINKKNRYFIS